MRFSVHRGVTRLLLYRDWIVDTARKFNSPLTSAR
jgi:hypothetical protein